MGLLENLGVVVVVVVFFPWKGTDARIVCEKCNWMILGTIVGVGREGGKGVSSRGGKEKYQVQI